MTARKAPTGHSEASAVLDSRHQPSSTAPRADTQAQGREQSWWSKAGSKAGSWERAGSKAGAGRQLARENVLPRGWIH